MGAGLAYIQERLADGWILNDGRKDAFTEGEALEPDPLKPVIVSDSDPIAYALKALRAIESKRPLLLSNPDAGDLSKIAQYLSEGDIAIATSGTGGQPRFAIHTLETLKASAAATKQFFSIKRMNPCCSLPLHHVSGFMQVIRSFYENGKICFHPWKDLESGILPQSNLNQISLVPTQLIRLMGQPNTCEWLKTLDLIYLGGAPAPATLLSQARTLRLPLAPCYGMTETASMVAALHPNDFLNEESALEALPHASLHIRDSQRNPVHTQETGRIWIQATSLAKGYLAQNHIIKINTLFASDDKGTLNLSGKLERIERIDHLINSGGEKIDPLEVERSILATKLVTHATISIIEDPHWQQIMHCDCTLAQNATLDALQSKLRGLLLPHQIPKSFSIKDKA